MGDGTALAFSGDLFTTGIEIVDPAVDDGAIIITYDVELREIAEINQTYSTLAEVSAYGSIDGGVNHATGLPIGSLSDDASITVQNVAASKSIESTSEIHTAIAGGIERVAVGEIVRYQLVVAIPEGTLPDLVITDRLPGGMQYIDDATATFAFISDAGISFRKRLGRTSVGARSRRQCCR